MATNQKITESFPSRFLSQTPPFATNNTTLLTTASTTLPTTTSMDLPSPPHPHQPPPRSTVTATTTTTTATTTNNTPFPSTTTIISINPPPPPPPLRPSLTTTTTTATNGTTPPTTAWTSRPASNYLEDPPSPLSSKLSLMCSYGGLIVPRPHHKWLCYVGGNTRRVVVDRAIALSSLLSYLSNTLLNGRPCSLKYQLPGEDLDFLISIITDEDLENMIDEYDISKSSSNNVSKPLCLCLFLFPLNYNSSNDGSDVVLVAAGGGSLEGTNKNVAANKEGEDVYSVLDSETTSSSSSPSLANLPPMTEDDGIRGVVRGIEDHFAQLSVGGGSGSGAVGQRQDEDFGEYQNQVFSDNEITEHWVQTQDQQNLPSLDSDSRHMSMECEDTDDDGISVPNKANILETGDEVNDSPIEQVKLIVPITDDPTLPCLTFRTWVLGTTFCCLLAFVNQFYSYHQNQLSVSSITAQIVVLPLGRLMAATLPNKLIRVPGIKWSFSLNPGPFNIKEHVLITIFVNSGSNGNFGAPTITAMIAFYGVTIRPLAAMLLSLTTQLLGYGWAGIFKRFLVDCPYMRWPEQLAQVSLLRTLHEVEVRRKGGLTRQQFFFMVIIASFAYYIVPGYFFQSITALSPICWVWKNSVIAQQIGSGHKGLGIGSFTLDWSSMPGYLGSPLRAPAFAIINTLVGYIVTLFIMIPIGYWTNSYNAKRFPLISSNIFYSNGQLYNVSAVLNRTTLELNQLAYESHGKANLSIYFIYSYGLFFAVLAASLTHAVLFHGRDIWQAKVAFQGKFSDVHNRIMKKNYDAVPQWWFYTILIVVIGLSIMCCEGFGGQLQLPFWGILLAIGLALIFTLPAGVIIATTNQTGVELSIISELIMGYMIPGKPFANISFKTYCDISMYQAIGFLSDFKLGHYMKIPPKSMFIAQVVATIISSVVAFGTAWQLLTNVEIICHPSKLPKGSPWTCPGYDLFYNISIIWGVVGPMRVFGHFGLYPKMNYFFLFGLFAPIPVWILSLKFPKKNWIKLINLPIILGSITGFSGVGAAGYTSWFAVGIFFNLFVYKRYKGWWARYNYILSTGLDTGIVFSGLLIFFALEIKKIDGPKWWGLELTDHCPLASCPTAPGIKVEGCLVF